MSAPKPRTNPQAVSRVLRAAGWRPASGPHASLRVTEVYGGVDVDCAWPTQSESVRQAAAITSVLRAAGYVVDINRLDAAMLTVRKPTG